MPSQLTRELGASFADIALSHITREYPAKMDHILTGPSDIQGPRALHPMFYGSFDWHSCVHGFWLLARIMRLFPDLPQNAKIRMLFNEQLTAENVAAEMKYLQRPMQGSFERPYGWAWLLMLASEFAQHTTTESKNWYGLLRPLANDLADRFKTYLAKLPFSIRAGTHANTAFAAAFAIEYAQVCKDPELLEIVRARMQRFFGSDVDSRAFEPNGNDFHSPILVEVECMRRILTPSDFPAWLDRFLPQLSQREPRVLFEPVMVSDHADPQFVHLDGLNFSRAWCWRNLSTSFSTDDTRRKLVLDSGEAHIKVSLPHITADYMGEHWLATYAVLALTA